MPACELLTGADTRLIDRQLRCWMKWALTHHHDSRKFFVGDCGLIGKLIEPVTEWSFGNGQTSLRPGSASSTENVMLYGVRVDMLDKPQGYYEYFHVEEKRFVTLLSLKTSSGMLLSELLSFVPPQVKYEADEAVKEYNFRELRIVVRGLFKDLGYPRSDANELTEMFIEQVGDECDLDDVHSQENIRLAIKFMNQSKGK